MDQHGINASDDDNISIYRRFELVSENLSPITKTPEYKYCAVNVERIADQRAAEQYVIDEYNKLKSRLRESAMG